MDILCAVLSIIFKVLAWVVLVGGALIAAVAFFIAIPMDQSLERETVTFVVVWLLLTVFLFGMSALLGIKPPGRDK